MEALIKWIELCDCGASDCPYGNLHAPRQQGIKCLVKGCTNHTYEGKFVGDKFMYLVLCELKSLQDATKDSAILPKNEWSDLEYWLDRCYEKGHLERCGDLIEPLEALYKARGFA